jgi:hypothetical protein
MMKDKQPIQFGEPIKAPAPENQVIEVSLGNLSSNLKHRAKKIAQTTKQKVDIDNRGGYVPNVAVNAPAPIVAVKGPPVPKPKLMTTLPRKAYAGNLYAKSTLLARISMLIGIVSIFVSLLVLALPYLPSIVSQTHLETIRQDLRTGLIIGILIGSVCTLFSLLTPLWSRAALGLWLTSIAAIAYSFLVGASFLRH